MKRWILATLLLVTPAFAATVNTFASQAGGTQLVQMVPGQFPLLTTTYAGMNAHGTTPGALIFDTVFAQIGTFTFSSSLAIGGQLFNIPVASFTCSATDASGCSVPSQFVMPKVFHPTQGTLTITVNGSQQTFGLLFQSPAPEPASLILLATGLAAITWRKYKAAVR